jgi:hypothetical protein
MSFDFRVRNLGLGLYLLSALVYFSLPTICPADVFTSSVTLVTGYGVPSAPNGQPSYEIQTWTGPNNSGDGAFLDVTISSSLVLSPYDYTVGIAQRWYDANLGDAFTIANSSSYPAFADTFTNPVTLDSKQLSVGEDFYLAFWLVDGPPGLGWAHLQLTSPTTLALLGNAIDNSGSGIYVGTMDVVPEPSAFCLTALVPLFLCCHRILPIRACRRR